MAQLEKLHAENLRLKEEVTVLRQQIEWLKKQLFGTGKSEKSDRLQMLLKLEGLEELARKGQERIEKIEYERRVPGKPNRSVPAETFKNLPVKETIRIVPEEVKADPDLYEEIGREVTFEVDITPPKLFKREIILPKFRHLIDRNRPPVIAPAPMRVTGGGGYASPGLMSWVVLSKYVDHLPLYRQEKMLGRWGAPISRKTMADWVEKLAEWFEPIYGLMRRELLAGDYLQADETPVRFMDPDQKKGKTFQGYLWVIGRPESDVVFDWRLSRRHDEATSLLEGFRGVLQTDGYKAYQSFTQANEQVVRLACLAHIRRKFVEALGEARVQVSFVLRLIGHLYAMEKQWDADGFNDPAQRAHLRQRDFVWTLSLLKKTALLLNKRARPRSNLGEACAYLLSQWSPLVTHCLYGQTRLDNNLIENAIRPSAIGKKNWLFIGSPEAGQKTAVVYSIVVSCQRHKIDPFLYLKDVLSRLPHMTNQDDLRPLLPANWQPSS